MEKFFENSVGEVSKLQTRSSKDLSIFEEADIGGVISWPWSTLPRSFTAKKIEEILGGIAVAFEGNAG